MDIFHPNAYKVSESSQGILIESIKDRYHVGMSSVGFGKGANVKWKIKIHRAGGEMMFGICTYSKEKEKTVRTNGSGSLGIWTKEMEESYYYNTNGSYVRFSYFIAACPLLYGTLCTVHKHMMDRTAPLFLF